MSVNVSLVNQMEVITSVEGAITVKFGISMGATTYEKEVAIVADEPNMFVLAKTPKTVQLFTETESGARRPLNLDFSFLNETISIVSMDDYDKVIIVYT